MSGNLITVPDNSPPPEGSEGLLSAEEKHVFEQIFHEQQSWEIEQEFGSARSRCRVFEVKYTMGDGIKKRTVVKIGPKRLIEQECRAHKDYVEDLLLKVPQLHRYELPEDDSELSGFRYTLVGGSASPVRTFYQYYLSGQKSSELRKSLRLLFDILRPWWRDSEVDRAFQMSSDYDNLLPVNLLIEPVDSLPEYASCLTISHKNLPRSLPLTDTYVELKGFEVTEVDRDSGQVTVNLKEALTGQKRTSFRVRLTGVCNLGEYKEGLPLASTQGRIVSTRHDLLEKLARQYLPEVIDLSADRIDWSQSLALPNPLQAYQRILTNSDIEAVISLVHMDLNLDNILIDVKTGQPNVIDFASVRHGHVFHDFLRLETEIVTRLISKAWASASLRPETIVRFYRLLHKDVFGNSDSRVDTRRYEEIHKDLVRPLNMLLTVRKQAHEFFRYRADWKEYYQGLVLYLVGSLRLKSLDSTLHAKRVAFIAAASVLDLLEQAQGLDQKSDDVGPFIPPCPYYGLKAFKDTDHNYFFGRSEDTDRLVDAIQKHSLVVVTGPSGSGKSSLVHAGLLARLTSEVSPPAEKRRIGKSNEDRHWLTTTFRPGSEPFEAAAEALAPLLGEPAFQTDPEGEIRRLARDFRSGTYPLDQVVRRILQREVQAGRLLLVVDQFDQLYIRSRDAELRQRFMHWLLATGQVKRFSFRKWLLGILKLRELPLTVVITLRSNFWKQLQHHLFPADILQDTPVLRITAMSRSDLEKAIREPANSMGVTFERGLMEGVLGDLNPQLSSEWSPEHPGGLQLVGLVLQSMWQYQRDQELTHEAYEKVGRVGGVVAQHAEQVYARLNQGERQQMRRVLTQLVRFEHDTEPVPRLVSQPDYSNDDWLIVHRLADERLVVTDLTSDDEETVRLVHFKLISDWERLRTWLEEDREFIQWREKLAESLKGCEASGRDPDLVPSQETLAEANKWRYRWGELSLAQLECLVESIRRLKSSDETSPTRLPRRRIVIGILALIDIVLLVLLGSRFGWEFPSWNDFIDRLRIPLGFIWSYLML